MRGMHSLWSSRAAYWLATGLVAVALAGCALPRMIDSDVQSFVGAAPAAAGASYRFERLPSQEAQGAVQDRFESFADAALHRVGLLREGPQARYVIQVTVAIEQFARNPQQQARSSSVFIADAFWGHRPPLLTFEQPWYKHTVHLLMRDHLTQQVVYETRAVFDGPWSDSDRLLPVLFEAALRDYPSPPSGPRKVVIELPAHDSQGSP